MKIEHQAVGVVDGDHAQRRQPGRGAAGLGRILLEPNHFGAGVQRVPDHREAVEAQAAVEKVGLDPLGDQGGLADRHVTDQGGVRQRGAGARHGVAQPGIQGQSHPVTDDGLMGGRGPEVSVIDGAQSNTWPTVRSSKKGPPSIWPDKVTGSHAGSRGPGVSIWPYIYEPTGWMT